MLCCEYCKFLKTPFLTKHLRWLLLLFVTYLKVVKDIFSINFVEMGQIHLHVDYSTILEGWNIHYKTLQKKMWFDITLWHHLWRNCNSNIMLMIQHFEKYFDTFSSFSIVYLYHKWNWSKLLSAEVEYTRYSYHELPNNLKFRSIGN